MRHDDVILTFYQDNASHRPRRHPPPSTLHYQATFHTHTHLIVTLQLQLLLLLVFVLVSKLSSLPRIQHRLQLDARASIRQAHVIALLQRTAAAAAVCFRFAFPSTIEPAERDAFPETVVDLCLEEGASAVVP